MSQKFDVVVIGAGPGGYVAAIRAAQNGFKTAIIEGHKMGGECLNYGCIPSKALISTGHIIDRVQEGEKYGLIFEKFRVDLPKLIDWKANIVKTLTGGIGQLLKANGVTAFQGTGEFESVEADGTKKIKVIGAVDSYDGGKGSGKDDVVLADKVIIATGSFSAEFPNLKIDGKSVLGSKEALDVTKTPKKIVVIGGGVIGLELGSFFTKLGTELEVVEFASGLLGDTDKECVDVVQRRLKKKGVKLHFETKVTKVESKGEGKTIVHAEDKAGKAIAIDCDWALLTVGRRPRTASLKLDKVGVELNDRGFIKVNSRLETNVPGIHAIGDVIGGAMLAHKASKEGLVCVETFSNPNVSMDIKALPWAIFVDPEIAGVGHTEESARAAGWDPVIGKCPFAANGRALTTGESAGFVKLIADKKTDRLLGAHMVGPEVSNLVQEVAMAIEMGATAEDVARTVHAHPTLPETIMEAAESVHGMAVHIYEKKKPTKGPAAELR
ncbi:dihydrolipoyl dehydrogenase [bacterium]|nr:dihydrolipoyl dehydrogenase [bacterium]